MLLVPQAGHVLADFIISAILILFQPDAVDRAIGCDEPRLNQLGATDR